MVRMHFSDNVRGIPWQEFEILMAAYVAALQSEDLYEVLPKYIYFISASSILPHTTASQMIQELIFIFTLGKTE